MKPTKKVQEQADERREMTILEARALPGLQGRIVAARLLENGWHGYVDADGRKILVVRVD